MTQKSPLVENTQPTNGLPNSLAVNGELSLSTELIPKEIPSNIYKLNAPFAATVLENRRLTAPDSNNDVRHLVFDLEGSGLWYIEGQSLGIVPPGEDTAGKAHKLRLYSIASPSGGDDQQNKTVSLCVKRAITVDELTGTVYKGICSGHLCDLEVGSKVLVTGPVGKAFIMPPVANANLIMIATGTGIAPFRAFLHNRYNPKYQRAGKSWLFFGAQTHKDFLYQDELKEYQKFPDFELTTAFSREEKTTDGQRMYVQHRIAEHAVEVFELLKKPNTYLYVCGLKGMETGILEALEKAGETVGQSWPDLLATLKAEKRWLLEVY